jgi:hypothetical protein
VARVRPKRPRNRGSITCRRNWCGNRRNSSWGNATGAGEAPAFCGSRTLIGEHTTALSDPTSCCCKVLFWSRTVASPHAFAELPELCMQQTVEPIGLWDVEAPTFYRQSAMRSALRAGRSLPPGRFLVLISVRIRWIGKFSDVVGNGTRDLPAYSTALKPAWAAVEGHRVSSSCSNGTSGEGRRYALEGWQPCTSTS